MRQPLLILALLFIAGFGAYRAFKYGTGRRRLLGVIPVTLVLAGGVILPLLFGLMQGAGAKPEVAGIGGGELALLGVVGPLLLAVISGAILSLAFRPK